MSKYLSKRIQLDGIRFDSKVEAQYYIEHKDQILKIHPRYILQSKFEKNNKKHKPITYIADFLLKDNTVIDIKGLPTETAKLKRKMFEYAYHGLTLKRLVRYRGERVDYDENEKRKRENKKKT